MKQGLECTFPYKTNKTKQNKSERHFSKEVNSQAYTLILFVLVVVFKNLKCKAAVSMTVSQLQPCGAFQITHGPGLLINAFTFTFCSLESLACRECTSRHHSHLVAAITEYHKIGGTDKTDLYFFLIGSWKSEIKLSTEIFSF